MSITIVIVTSALASAAGASLVTFLIQRFYDRRLEYYFNSRLEELKSNLSYQGDMKSQFIAKRLEIYPSISELIYRLRNQFKEISNLERIPLEKALDFVRLAEQFTEKIYSARFYLELDGIFESLHHFKSHILSARNLLLDWIFLVHEEPSQFESKVDNVVAQMIEVGNELDNHHDLLIRSLTKLTST